MTMPTITDLFTKLSADLRGIRSKLAFVPTPGGAIPGDPAAGGGAPPMDPAMAGAPPMDPAMMAAGGGAPPMDPAMAGAPQMAPAAAGAPPMDPAMMAAGGGAPSMDPAMAGAPPMDPAMAGAPPMDPAMAGAPPMDPAMAGAPDGMVSMPFSQLIELIGILVGGRADAGSSAPGGGPQGTGAGAGPAKPKKQTTDQKLDMLLQAVGLPAQPTDPAGGDKVGSVNRSAKIERLVNRVLSNATEAADKQALSAAHTGTRLTSVIAVAAARRLLSGG